MATQAGDSLARTYNAKAGSPRQTSPCDGEMSNSNEFNWYKTCSHNDI
jgi:hypothetical protein